MDSLKKRLRTGVSRSLSGLPLRLASLIGRTLRVETRGFAAAPVRTIYCGWHGLSFPFATHFRDRDWWVMISLSRDGDLQNAIFEGLGYRTVRGSTRKGGARAAVGAIKALRAGGVLAMTPDGPRGPSEVVQEGALLIAQRSGAVLVPVGIAMSATWFVARSWDRYRLPRPFARVRLVAGEGLAVPPDATPEETETIRAGLQDAIARLTREAERGVGR